MGCKKLRTVHWNPNGEQECFFDDNNFPETATILVPKGKLKKYKAVFQKFETDTYKIRVREMKK